MRKSLLIILTGLLLAGCTSETKYGKCIGIGGTQNPKYTYEVPTRNIVIGAIFIETIFVPVIVLVKETSCPVALAPVPTPGAQ